MRILILSFSVLAILTGCLAATAIQTTGKVAGVAAGVAIGTTGKVVKGTASLVSSDDEDDETADTAQGQEGDKSHNSPEFET